MNQSNIIKWIFLVAFCQLLGPVGCSETEVGALSRTDDQFTNQPIPVSLTQVHETDLVEPIFATGTIHAEQTTDISPIVSGLVENVFVNVGDRVEKDQPLFQIRQTEIQEKVTQLTHAVTLARAELSNTNKDLATKRALRQRGAVSQEVLDNTITHYEVSRAQFGIAESQLAEATQALTDTISRAPYRGVITRREINEGSYIRNMPGASSMALQIQKIDRVEATISVPEKFLSQIKLGTAAKIIIDGLNQSFDSQIDIINDRVDQQSRTIEVRLGINNPDYKIKPGLFVRVELYPPSRKAIVLSRSIIQGTITPFVYMEERGFAKKVSVVVRELDNGQIEIVEGLKPETFVIAGSSLAKVSPGASIRVLAEKE